MNTKSRVAGVFIGLAVGDALGVPLEKMDIGSFDFVSEMLSLIHISDPTRQAEI